MPENAADDVMTCKGCNAPARKHYSGLCGLCRQRRKEYGRQKANAEARRLNGLDRWARNYDALNGAPESDRDR